MTTTRPFSDTPAIRAAISVAERGQGLQEAAAHAAMLEMLGGTTDPVLTEALLVALRDKGESAPELAGAVRALRDTMQRVDHSDPGSLVDTCGTGGGTVTTLNISTAAAFVVAGAGIPVAKHGNRSFTSRSGSADVLEAMGVSIDATPAQSGRILREVGIAFLFAPTHHPAMRHVAAVRRKLGTPTIMNLVGPLANPAGATRQVIGVADPRRGALMATTLAHLGARHAMVVHGVEGLDEIAPMGETMIWEVRGGDVRQWTMSADTLGFRVDSLAGLAGGEPAENAAAIVQLFERPRGAPPAVRAAVVLNAGAAILVSGKAESMEDAVEMAHAALDSGRALATLEDLRSASVSTSE
ncbi:MAG: anthranilate phosphoribosyltransferase [Gemmatimonadales bacterium]|nr:anthranilate phosphoribosyltransferase [Gemmatimonadales bacterium]